MRRPNIIHIFCDQLRADALGCYGNSVIKTPNIDMLSETGTTFARCIITHPTCTPHRASVLTGRYPSAICTRMVGSYTPKDELTLPAFLRNNSYMTASVGKIHLVPQMAEMMEVEKTGYYTSKNDDPKMNYDYYGFSKVWLADGHGDECFGHYTAWAEKKLKRKISDEFPKERYLHGTKDTYVSRIPKEAHSSEYISEKASEFIRSAGDSPFYLHVSFPDPHHPYVVPSPYDSMYDPQDMPDPIPAENSFDNMPMIYEDVYKGKINDHMIDWYKGSLIKKNRPGIDGAVAHDWSQYTNADWKQVRALYYGMVTMIDTQIGRIIDTLKECGVYNNSIIIFMSDHGDYLGDHGISGKGFHYDSVIRIPLIYSCPGMIRTQKIYSTASTIDIMPTIIELAGAEEPPGLQGISTAKTLISGEKPVRTAAMTETDNDHVPIRARSISTNMWRMTYYIGEDFGELFDLTKDPAEITNLWYDARYEDIKTTLTRMLLEEVMAADDTKNGRLQPPMTPSVKFIPLHNK